MRLALFLLLLLAWSCATTTDYHDVATDNSITLPLYEHQYVTVLVGSTGREVVLRLRWDLNQLVLFTPPDPKEYSTSYWLDPSPGNTPGWQQRGMDVLYLGSRRLILPVLYANPSSVRDPSDSSGRVTHHGLLPLGPESPLWRYWQGWTWSKLFLTLGNVHVAMRYTEPVMLYEEGHLQACWGDQEDQCTLLVPEIQNDYSSLDVSSYTAWLQQENWMLRVWKNSTKQNLMLYVDALTQDQNEMQLDKVRMSGEEQGYFRVGLEHLGAWILSYDIAEDQLFLASMPSWFVRRVNYCWLLVATFTLMTLWWPGVFEHVHVSRWHREQQHHLLNRLPPDQVYALLWMTRLCLWFLLGCLQWQLRPYLVMRLIQHPYATAGTHWPEVIYGLCCGYVLIATTMLGQEVTRALVLHITSACFVVSWLLLALQFHFTMNAIIMVVLSGLLFMIQADLLLWLLYRRQSVRWYVVLWSAACVLGSAWFFAFYNMAFYLESRWPDHPSLVVIELLVLMTLWCFASFFPFVEEHSVQYRANVTRAYNKLFPGNAAATTATPQAPLTTSAAPPGVYNLLAPQGRIPTLMGTSSS